MKHKNIKRFCVAGVFACSVTAATLAAHEIDSEFVEINRSYGIAASEGVIGRVGAKINVAFHRAVNSVTPGATLGTPREAGIAFCLLAIVFGYPATRLGQSLNTKPPAARQHQSESCQASHD